MISETDETEPERMKDYVTKSIVACLFVLGSQALMAQNGEPVQDGMTISQVNALGDSLLRSYSVDEILSYKAFYEDERERLEQERSLLRDKGISDLEAFVRSHPESHVLDKVIFRLAELYYDKAEEDYLLAQERYGELLDEYDAGRLTELPQEPKKDFSRSLALYRSIIDNFPQSRLVDDAHYNIAFITESQGDITAAQELYETFLEEFPDSRYVPEVLMRQAEYYFNPPVNQIETAIEIYNKVLKYKDTPRYDEALYRLGWSYYRINDYPRAISYFTLLADDITAAKEYDPDNKMTNPSLADESIEYIGISFLDYTGIDGAARYLEKIGGREYGFEILKKIGDSYMDVKEEYEHAISSFNVLLKMYPFHKDAPMIQARIAEAYRLLDDDANTYFMRKKLFANYHEGTEWWQKVEDKEARARAAQLSEHALRANINLLLESASEQNNESLYAQAVDDSREYLKVFQEDSNAARIHWNMALTLDSRLKMASSAFDEYIKISNLYWNTRFQKEAARNAIALAQDFVNADTASRGDETLPLTIGEMREQAQEDSVQLRKNLRLEPQPLTEGEKKLVQAIDNYIKLFPFEEGTAARLSQAGSIYYNRNDFRNALKYFKTLLKHFPDDPSAGNAEVLVMESYFGRLDYKSVEIVAKRIRTKTDKPEYAAKATKRLAESIFLQAESLADSAQHFKAAEEYRRVALEVPDAKFADLALFNSGLEYDKAREYSRAVETYDIILQYHKDSEYYISAMNNMALDYGELKEYKNAALVFERLAEEDPDSLKGEAHLYNASFFYVKAEDWERAIRVNQKFVNRYPDSEDADDLYYDIANYHLKLDQFDKANEIYGKYAEKFPDSPRVVETYFRRGRYFEKQGDLAAARSEYEKGIAKSDQFRKEQKDANDYFAAEALFRLTELKLKEFEQIEFRLPKDRLVASKKRKRDLLLDIVDSYTRVAAYGTIRLYESTWKIGYAYEDFAETWAEQDIVAADEARRIVAQKEINQAAADLYERAVEAYKNSLDVLTRISRQYAESFLQKPEPHDSTSAPGQGQKITVADTTLQVAERWIERSKVKISENIYDIAEINFASVKKLLSAPVPEGMDKITELEYRNQLIGKFIRPMIAEIVQAHIRNITESEQLGLQNKWVDFSKNKVVATSALIPNEYARLAWESLQSFAAKYADFVSTLPDDDVVALSLADEMANFIDFGNAFGKATVTAYEQTIKRALKQNIANYELLKVEDGFLEFVYNFAMYADSLGSVAAEQKRAYESLFKTTEDPRYEDGLFSLEDNYFSLSDITREILGTGYEVARSLDLQNQYTEKIVLAIVRSDPEQYAGILDLEVSSHHVGTDTSWLASPVAQQGWQQVAYADDSWQAAAILDSSAQFSTYGAFRIWLKPGVPVTQMEAPDSVAADSMHVDPVADSVAVAAVQDSAGVSGDSLAVVAAAAEEQADSTVAVSGNETISRVYFRRIVNLAGLPVSGQIQLFADDTYRFYVNGELISASQQQEGQPSQVHEFSDFLVSGQNILALVVDDTDGSGKGIDGVVFLKNLPGWDERQKELRAQREKKKENLLFDKGILIEN